MSTREKIEQRVFNLRCDDRFDTLLTEQLSRSPEVNKLVLTGKVDVEQLREFALRAVEVAFLREADAKHELPDARYEEHVEQALAHVGELSQVSVVQREAFRSWLRYLFTLLNLTRPHNVAWRAFARLAPPLVLALAAAHDALIKLLDDEG